MSNNTTRHKEEIRVFKVLKMDRDKHGRIVYECMRLNSKNRYRRKIYKDDLEGWIKNGEAHIGSTLDNHLVQITIISLKDKDRQKTEREKDFEVQLERFKQRDIDRKRKKQSQRTIDRINSEDMKKKRERKLENNSKEILRDKQFQDYNISWQIAGGNEIKDTHFINNIHMYGELEKAETLEEIQDIWEGTTHLNGWVHHVENVSEAIISLIQGEETNTKFFNGRDTVYKNPVTVIKYYNNILIIMYNTINKLKNNNENNKTLEQIKKSYNYISLKRAELQETLKYK